MVEPPIRTVTAAFSDLVNSVGLAEQLSAHAYFNEVLDPFKAIAKEVITDHGGKIRPVFAGDQVLAVFGVPVEHVDDAMRAVEAAVALRSRVAELSARLQRDRNVSIEVHTGVNTGSALVREPHTDPTAVFGDAVNVGARLQDAAAGGEILLGPVTYQLVRDVATAEPVPLVVRGKGTPMTAWRLLGVARGGERPMPRLGAPLVGRALELALLRLSYERMLQEHHCHLVNVLGATGIGKSRLVEEFVRTLDSVPLILRGRCPPYGPGITYRPIMQLVQQAAGITSGDSDDEMRSRVMRLVDDDERITARVMRLVGVPGSIGDPDETFRAVQRTFELLAERQPLVLVIEDLHAAQPASVEGIERLVESLRNSRVLVFCMARSEFMEGRRDWGGSIPNTTSLQLSPLNEQQAMQLLSHVLDGGEPPAEVQERVSLWAGGNPFYLEELVAMLIDEQTLQMVDDRWEVRGDLSDLRATPKIQAVLGARLSRLGEEERTVIQHAAVVGQQFEAADVEALLPEDHRHSEIVQILDGLVDKELLVHDLSVPMRGTDGHAFSFRHLLIQDTAYRRLDKGTRSALHRRYAEWLERTEPASPASSDQIGFHLDKAYRDRVEELGREDDEARALAHRAGGFLATAGHEYVLQGDFPISAVSSLRRAVELLSWDDARRLQTQLDLAEALRDQGAAEAGEAFARVEEAAKQAGDKQIEMHALLGRLELEWFREFRGDWNQGRQEIGRTILEFVRSGDSLGLAKAYRLLAYGYASVGQSTNAREAAEQAIEFVRRAGQERLEAKILRLYCVILFWGPTPLDEVVRKNREALEWARARGLYTLEAGALGILARAAAMRGDFTEARRLSKEARNTIADVGELLTVAYDSISEGLIELLAGEPDAAVSALHRGIEALERRGGENPLAVLAANLARAFIVKGQDDDAEPLIRRCREASADSQLDTQIKWRALQAVVLAHRGEFDEAQRLAREAVVRAEQSEQLDSQAEALADLADVLHRAGAVQEAVQHAERSLALYERKGNLVSAARVRRLLAHLAAPR